VREGWKAFAAPGAAPSGAALENRKLVVVVRPGAAGAVLHAKGEGAVTRVELALVGAGGGAAKISRVELLRLGGSEAVLRLAAGGVSAEITLGAGRAFVEVKPAWGGALEVRANARYAVLPDFFADDTVYDARKFKAKRLTVPAENFLFQFSGGGRALVMCVWPGAKPLAEGEAKPAPAPAANGREPRVDVLFKGEGDARRVAGGRIEFVGRSVYVAVLEHAGLWHDEAVADWTGYKPTVIEWKRSFDAKWRATFIVAEGKETKDWHTRSQSFYFKGPVKPGGKPWWSRKGNENEPRIWQEALSFMIYPCWFHGDATRLCLYADGAERRQSDKTNKQEQRKAQKARKEGKEYEPKLVYPPNIYERVLIYPIDRLAGTPVSVYTPVDIMRDTLGQGPCEYVLDLEGVKPRPHGGKREILEAATCPLWDKHVFPLSRKAKGGNLNEEDKKHLIQALEDMRTFVHAVHDRLREYKKWGGETAAFVKAEGGRSAALKPLADKVMKHLDALNGDVGRLKFEGPNTEGFWDKRLGELIAQVEADKYDEVGQAGKIRNLGNYQDQMVARCRRYVKGARQEAALADLADPEVRAFAEKLRAMTHQMLRNRHGKEGL